MSERERWDSTIELMERYEPLRDDLKCYVQETRFGPFIERPFCNTLIHDLDRCALIHHEIDRREAIGDAHHEAYDWEAYIANIEFPSRPEWFAKMAADLPDDRYWAIIPSVFCIQKHTFWCRELFEKACRSDRPGRENMMDPAEREVLAKLPDVLTVYRGFSDDDEEGYEDGISWTLDRRAAVWYANWNREHEQPRVVTGRVRKQDVWAYFDGGDLLLPPEAVYHRSVRDAWSDEARANAYSVFIKRPFKVEKLFAK